MSKFQIFISNLIILQGWTNDFKRFVSNGEQSMKFCVSIEHYENLTKQESILDIKNQFPVLLIQLEDDMKDFNNEILCIRFAKIFNEKCQNNLDPLYEEYCKIKRCRYDALNVSFISCYKTKNNTFICFP